MRPAFKWYIYQQSDGCMFGHVFIQKHDYYCDKSVYCIEYLFLNVSSSWGTFHLFDFILCRYLLQGLSFWLKRWVSGPFTWQHGSHSPIEINEHDLYRDMRLLRDEMRLQLLLFFTAFILPICIYLHSFMWFMLCHSPKFSLWNALGHVLCRKWIGFLLRKEVQSKVEIVAVTGAAVFS